ncbi:hypothetical protein, partial [Spongiibacter sp. UBA6593]
PVLKTGDGRPSQGSNPCPSAIFLPLQIPSQHLQSVSQASSQKAPNRVSKQLFYAYHLMSALLIYGENHAR